MPEIERTQTRVRIEKSLLKVIKGLAEYCDLSAADSHTLTQPAP